MTNSASRVRRLAPVLGLMAVLGACAAPASPRSTPVPVGAPDVAAAPTASPPAGKREGGAYARPASPAFEGAVARGTRTATGVPGPRYWQQEASYVLEAELQPTSKRLVGRGTVTYRNRSPDALPVLFVHAYPNLFAPDAKRNAQVMSALGGIVFTRVAAAGRVLDSVETGPGWTVEGTVMELRLPAPLPPGGEVVLEFGWNFRVPPEAPRGGQDRETYLLSYWYPQVAVYDDVNGWQADPYLGTAEFYMGYADYDVTLRVPAGWLVSATGELANADSVLQPAVRERLDSARRGTAVVRVVEEAGRGAGKATTGAEGGVLAWRFRASGVRDFTWATSALYLWDAVPAEVGDRDGDGRPDSTLVHAFYRPDRRRAGWTDMARDGGDIVRDLSQVLWPYPYPHMSVVDGPASCGGMEYPMLTCLGGSWSARELFLTTAHEIAHMWFPMQVGSDEKRHAWQDEGMAQFFETYPMRRKYPDVDDLAESRRSYLDALRGGETELMRHGDKYPGYFNYGVASYYKPAAVLGALREMVGDSTFLRAFREYGRRWSRKHPMPQDFFNTVNAVAGRDLDWFWRAWYYETWKLDQALGEVVRRGDSATVEVQNRGKVPMPVLVVARGARGDTTSTTVPAEAFLGGAKSVTVTMRVPADLVRIEIDPDRRMPDIDPLNQTWPRRDD